MSRIEKALEKAMKLRTDKPAAVNSRLAGQYNMSNALDISVDSPYIVTLNEPESPISEEYRKLKSMLVKAGRQNGSCNTLMVTSSVAGEGKSITAINLAITLAQEYDHTVLLIDTDLRKSSLQKYLNLNPGIGLSDCLINDIDIGQALIKTKLGRLSFLPAGNRVKNPAELLSSAKMKTLINEMKRRYSDRFIIVDAPPVLPSAETRILGTLFDGIVFVVKEGMVPLRSINDALEILSDTNILGVVFNDVSAESLNGRRYHYYYDMNVKSEQGD